MPRATAISASWVASSASSGSPDDPAADRVDPVDVAVEQQLERRAVTGGGRERERGVVSRHDASGTTRHGHVTHHSPDADLGDLSRSRTGDPTRRQRS